jgi:hypothetical protein
MKPGLPVPRAEVSSFKSLYFQDSRNIIERFFITLIRLPTRGENVRGCCGECGYIRIYFFAEVWGYYDFILDVSGLKSKKNFLFISSTVTRLDYRIVGVRFPTDA